MSVRATMFSLALVLGVAGLPVVMHTGVAMADDAAAKTDVSGTYTWEMGRGGGGGGGGGGQTTTLTLKQDGSKLTGTISGGRGGDTDIEEGKVEDGKLSFKVTREFNGNKMVTSYSGTVEGETLKLTVTTSRDVEAKKQS